MRFESCFPQPWVPLARCIATAWDRTELQPCPHLHTIEKPIQIPTRGTTPLHCNVASSTTGTLTRTPCRGMSPGTPGWSLYNHCRCRYRRRSRNQALPILHGIKTRQALVKLRRSMLDILRNPRLYQGGSQFIGSQLHPTPHKIVADSLPARWYLQVAPLRNSAHPRARRGRPTLGGREHWIAHRLKKENEVDKPNCRVDTKRSQGTTHLTARDIPGPPNFISAKWTSEITIADKQTVPKSLHPELVQTDITIKATVG